VEQPKRIAGLIGEWLANGWCSHCMFNLKLPMKQRYDELLRCRQTLLDRASAAGIECELKFKHLYHDREEVTGYAARVVTQSAARKKARGRRDQSPSQWKQIES